MCALGGKWKVLTSALVLLLLLLQADLEVMAKMLGGARETLPIVVDENGRRLEIEGCGRA